MCSKTLTTTTACSSSGEGVSSLALGSLVGCSLATGSGVMCVEDRGTSVDSSGSEEIWFIFKTTSVWMSVWLRAADWSAAAAVLGLAEVVWYGFSSSTWGAGLLWPVIGPGSGWLMMTRGTWGLLLVLRLDLAELRMAMARAAGLAAGWLMSSDRAGPSGRFSETLNMSKVFIWKAGFVLQVIFAFYVGSTCSGYMCGLRRYMIADMFLHGCGENKTDHRQHLESDAQLQT